MAHTGVGQSRAAARGEGGDWVGQSEVVATAAALCPPTHTEVHLSTHSRQSPLVPEGGSWRHSSVPGRGLASDGSSFQPPGCRGVLQAKLASQGWQA